MNKYRLLVTLGSAFFVYTGIGSAQASNALLSPTDPKGCTNKFASKEWDRFNMKLGFSSYNYALGCLIELGPPLIVEKDAEPIRWALRKPMDFTKYFITRDEWNSYVHSHSDHENRLSSESMHMLTHIRMSTNHDDEAGSSEESTIDLSKPIVFNTDHGIQIDRHDNEVTLSLSPNYQHEQLQVKNMTVNDEAQLVDTLHINQQGLRVNTGKRVDFGGNRLQRVGYARQDDDAITLGQTKSLIQSEFAQHTNLINKGIAGAMAMSALSQPLLPGDRIISVGTAHYAGQTAIAAGMGYASLNGNWIFKGHLSHANQVAVSASVSYVW